LIKLSTHSFLDPNGSGKTSLRLVNIILGVTLTLVIILTVLMFYIYNKRVRNRIIKQIANQKRPQSDEIETYDDIDLPSDLGGKDIYDTYDVVVDEESRYAEPYYSTEQDYVQMHSNTEKLVQSIHYYLRISTSESN